MIEKWKDIKGFESAYMVSNTGRIKSKDRTIESGRGWNVTRKSKVIKLSINKATGYYMINLNCRGKKYPKLIHRLVAQAFIPNKLSKETVNHKDGNKLNNHVSNLEWATRSEQNIHASKMGLKKFTGVNHSQHKLTESQVIEIRSRKIKPLGSEFGVSDMTISDILKRRSWKHL